MEEFHFYFHTLTLTLYYKILKKAYIATEYNLHNTK